MGLVVGETIDVRVDGLPTNITIDCVNGTTGKGHVTGGLTRYSIHDRGVKGYFATQADSATCGGGRSRKPRKSGRSRRNKKSRKSRKRGYFF